MATSTGIRRRGVKFQDCDREADFVSEDGHLLGDAVQVELVRGWRCLGVVRAAIVGLGGRKSGSRIRNTSWRRAGRGRSGGVVGWTGVFAVVMLRGRWLLSMSTAQPQHDGCGGADWAGRLVPNYFVNVCFGMRELHRWTGRGGGVIPGLGGFGFTFALVVAKQTGSEVS